MKILVINPIMYTSETKKIKRANSIKDTMMYDLCLAFHDLGHDVTLVGGAPFKPLLQETYPFEVLWWECKYPRIFLPHCIPYMPETRRYIKKHSAEFDMIISSEVFSVNSLIAYRCASDKVIIWHELAKHNAVMKKIPSKFWYNVIPTLFMHNVRVVARSIEARDFISQYCRNTSNQIIDHGVNLNKFIASSDKDDYFVVCSQLIKRKRIDGIITSFEKYLREENKNTRLYIIGDGNERNELEKLSVSLKLGDRIKFMGKLTHDELLPILSHAKAMLVNTEKDNSMISIVEAIAVGTPVVTTEVPLNASYIKKYKLGIAKEWTSIDLKEISDNNRFYVMNCLKYRETISTKTKVEQFITEYDVIQNV